MPLGKNSGQQIPIVILVFILITPAFSGCTNDEEPNFGGGDQLVTVEATEMISGSLPLVYRTTGEMRARNQVDIYPEINARITEVRVNDGDRVSEGDTLVRLRDDDVREQLNQARYDYEIAQAQLRQSEASLRRLEAQYQRTKELTERELEAELELETIQADIDAAEASVDLARSQMERARSSLEEQRTNLENTVVRAPIDGVVGSRNADIGQQANTSSRLFQIGDIDNMEIRVMLTERMSNAIQPGDQAELISDENSENAVAARVARISPFLDPVTHTTIAQLEVEQSHRRLQPGMFVTVDIYYGETDETAIVPKAALYDHPIEGQLGIYIADLSSADLEFEPAEPDQEQTDRQAQLTANPVPVRFVPVETIAESRGMVGIAGIDQLDGWVVTVGQNQLAEWESETAYVRRVDLEHVISLQNLQTRDMERLIFGNNQ